MPTANDGVMIILSSPSGVGKTTIVKLLSKIENFKVSISHTTRQPRPSETPDRDYYFVSEEKFNRLIKNQVLFQTKHQYFYNLDDRSARLPESIFDLHFFLHCHELERND